LCLITRPTAVFPIPAIPLARSYTCFLTALGVLQAIPLTIVVQFKRPYPLVQALAGRCESVNLMDTRTIRGIRMFDRHIPLSGMLLMSMPAIAQPPASAPTIRPSTQIEKLSCRAENSAASRLSKKMCHTDIEWNAIAVQNGKKWMKTRVHAKKIPSRSNKFPHRSSVIARMTR
jgi:hypothetical protein